MIVLGIVDSKPSAAAILCDGQIIAAIAEERLCRMKLAGGMPRAAIAEVMAIADAHRDWVLYVAYSPDGKQMVSCGGRDPRIRIWDAVTGQETMSLRTSSRWIEYVDYDSTGQYVLSGDLDNGIHIWDLASGENVMTLRGHHWPMRTAVFSPDGRRIVSAGQDKSGT